MLFENEYLNNPSKEYVITKWIRQEFITSDLKKILKTKKNITVPFRNKSKGAPSYKELYDDELIDLICKKDFYIFDKFNYTKEGF